MTDDQTLLCQFASEGSEASFRELVSRRLDFVYAAALRQVGGDVHLAREVAQSVFLDVARKAPALAQRPTITGWLYTSVRFAAAKALRARARRFTHESEAHTMQDILAAQSGEINWPDLRPVIDAALHKLGERDREAILLRYFEGRSLAEVAAGLGLSESAARMRIDRAVEKLRLRLARRGITSTAAALSVALANHAGDVAPAGLAGAIAAARLSPEAGSGATSFTPMNTLKLLAGMAAAGAAGVGIAYATMQTQWQNRLAAAEAQAGATATTLRADNERLQRDLNRARETAAATPAEDPLADLRALVRAAQQKPALIGPMTQLLRTNNGQLQSPVVKLLNLNPEERTAVEKALSDVRVQLDELAAANVSSVDLQSPSRVVMTFKLFPDTGARVYDQFTTALARALGPERHSAILTLMADNFEIVGSGFGIRERTLTINRQSESTQGRTSYTVIDRVQLALTSSGSVKTGDRPWLEREFPALAKLLPADF